MPDQDQATYSLTSTYVPTGERENLAAFVAVDADPGPDYGTFRVLQLPRSLQINGPSQVQNAFESDDTVAEEINILKRGTTVKYGNLLTLPLGGGLLYVEPVYVQSESTTSFPLLRKVLVSFGNDVAFEDTLEQALDSLFEAQGGVSPPTRRRDDRAAAPAGRRTRTPRWPTPWPMRSRRSRMPRRRSPTATSRPTARRSRRCRTRSTARSRRSRRVPRPRRRRPAPARRPPRTASPSPSPTGSASPLRLTEWPDADLPGPVPPGRLGGTTRGGAAR